MSEKTIAFIYLNVYCVLLFVIDAFLALFHAELETPKGMANVLLDYIGLIAVLGYAYDKKMASKYIWLLFALIFVGWKIYGYVHLDKNPLQIKAMIIIMYAPMFWSIILYPLLTMEEDEIKKTTIALKRDKLKERFKSFYVIFSALSFLILVLCLAVMVMPLFMNSSGL